MAGHGNDLEGLASLAAFYGLGVFLLSLSTASLLHTYGVVIKTAGARIGLSLAVSLILFAGRRIVSPFSIDELAVALVAGIGAHIYIGVLGGFIALHYAVSVEDMSIREAERSYAFASIVTMLSAVPVAALAVYVDPVITLLLAIQAYGAVYFLYRGYRLHEITLMLERGDRPFSPDIMLSRSQLRDVIDRYGEEIDLRELRDRLLVAEKDYSIVVDEIEDRLS